MNTEQKIRELVPGLQELTFGCEYEHNDTKYILVKDEYNGEHLLGYDFCNGSYTTTLWRKMRDEIKILGHPIQLHHVLRAVSPYQNTTVSFSKSSSGYVEINQRQADVLTVWDLTKDYQNQSEEVKEFIGNLLN